MKRIPVLSVAVLLAMCLAACALPEEFSEKIGAAASVAEDSAYTQGENLARKPIRKPPQKPPPSRRRRTAALQQTASL